MLVQTKDGVTSVPASNFTENGSALISTMGEADQRKEPANGGAAAAQPAPVEQVP